MLWPPYAEQQIWYSRRAAAMVSAPHIAAMPIRKRESTNGNVQLSFETQPRLAQLSLRLLERDQTEIGVATRMRPDFKSLGRQRTHIVPGHVALIATPLHDIVREGLVAADHVGCDEEARRQPERSKDWCSGRRVVEIAVVEGDGDDPPEAPRFDATFTASDSGRTV